MKDIKKILKGIIPLAAVVFALLASCSDFSEDDSGSATLNLDGRALASRLVPLFAESSGDYDSNLNYEIMADVYFSYDGKNYQKPFLVLSMTGTEVEELNKKSDEERHNWLVEKINGSSIVLENLPVGKDVLFGMKVISYTSNDYKWVAISKERKSVRVGTDKSVSLVLTDYTEELDWSITPIKLTLKFPSDATLSNNMYSSFNVYKNYENGWHRFFVNTDCQDLELDTEKKTATAKFYVKDVFEGDKICVGFHCSAYIDGSNSYFQGLSSEMTAASGTNEISIDLEKTDEYKNVPAPASFVDIWLTRDSNSPISDKYLRITFEDENGKVIETIDREFSALNEHNNVGFSIPLSNFGGISDGATITAKAAFYSDSARTAKTYSGSNSFTFYKNTSMEVFTELGEK